MRRIFIVFSLLLAVEASAQTGPVELGKHCGDDHRSATKQIQKAIRAMNQRDYPNAFTLAPLWRNSMACFFLNS